MSDLGICCPDLVFDVSDAGVTITRLADGEWRASTSGDVASVFAKMLTCAQHAHREWLLALMFDALASAA